MAASQESTETPSPTPSPSSAACVGHRPVDGARPHGEVGERQAAAGHVRRHAGDVVGDSPMAEASASGDRARRSRVGLPPVRVAPSSSTTRSSTPTPHSWRTVPAGQPAGAHERVRRADARVTGEGQLGERREDAHPVVGAGLGRRAEERRLRQVELEGQRLALLGGQVVGVEHHGQRIAREGPRGEHVDDLVLQHPRACHGADGSLRDS